MSDRYVKKIAALNRVAPKIKEMGGEHDKWNILVENLTTEERQSLLDAGWYEDEENGWSFYTFT